MVPPLFDGASVQVTIVSMVPPFAPLGHEPRAPERRQVLRDRRLRHARPRGQLLDRRLAVREPLEDRPPRRVGERAEDLPFAVHRITYKHILIRSSNEFVTV